MLSEAESHMKKITNFIRSAIQSLRGPLNEKDNPTGAEDPADEVAQAFVKRHLKSLRSLGLTPIAEGFLWQETKKYSDRDIEIELQAEEMETYDLSILGNPDLKHRDAANGLLTVIRDNLARDTTAEISKAEAALKKLADVALTTTTFRWIPEAEVRRVYLNFPKQMTAAEADRLASKSHNTLRARLAKAQFEFVSSRVKNLTSAKMHGKELSFRYPEHPGFLTVGLALDLNVQVTLNDKELTRLVDTPEDKFSDVIDGVLERARKALAGKVQLQVRELERRINSLPHIELLTDDEIAATVAPYYGGLSRDLKRRRAKNALVAVEERAREAKYQGDVIKLNDKRDLYADVAGYYPAARSLKRQLVLYVGPTNSGKTWRSLNDLATAESGAYLAPLRLLALEGQEELEKRGIPTSYVTGEERDIRPDARFVSSTIEMLNIDNVVGAVVIDEVQMLVDERRGWAWLAAVVGAPAAKVIMTGSPDCVEIVKDLAAYLGEELTIIECQRYNELRVADKPMRLRDIRPGMAIVCFSRRDVQRIKNTIQENSDLKVAVVYGNLSPRVRREEARRFNSGEAEILVATDAIAMGLNLPISEVLFYTTMKFNGEETVELSTSDIRQIGGRAGRYGFAQYGVVNALDEDSLDRIKNALAEKPATLTPPYYVAPGPNHIRIIGDVLGSDSLERILTFFERAIEFLDDRFTRANIDDLSFLSSFVDQRLPFLKVTERLTVASAPVGIRNETVMRWFIDRMLSAFPDPEDPDRNDQLDDLFEAANRFDRDVARSQLDLRDAEDYLKTLTVYSWLAFRHPDVFTRIEECEECRELVNGFVERTLRSAVTSERPKRTRSERGDRGKGDRGDQKQGRGNERNGKSKGRRRRN